MHDYLDSPIIFLGFGRSGTTIISEIIFQHPDIAWISNYQAKFPKSKTVNLFRNIFDNSLWKVKGQKKQLNKVPWYNKYIFLPSEHYAMWNELTGKNFGREYLLNVIEENKKKEIRDFFNSLVKYQCRKRLGFKITGPSRLEYLHSIFPDAKFIWIKREPLPNIRSLLKVDFYQDRKDKIWWIGDDIYSNNEIEFIKEWDSNPSIIAALQYFKVHNIFKKECDKLNIPENILKVSYESFIDEPDKVITDLLKFLQLENNKIVFEYLKELNIYNRNKKEDYYISKELDSVVNKVALNGVDSL